MPRSTSPGVFKSRILIVDDHPIVRQGLTLLINREKDLAVCGDAEEACTAMRQIRETKPNLIVVDISLNGPDGIDLLKEIRLRQPNMPVLILSMLDEQVYAERALRAGANGYIMKHEATERVLVAIRRILGGEIYISDRLANHMLYQRFGGSGASQSKVDELTDRELEVFRLIGEGHATRDIAEVLHLSVKTVEGYQAHIKDKLSLKNARELMQFAIQRTQADKEH